MLQRTILHADAKGDGTNFQGKYERNWLELTAVDVVENSWLFTDFFLGIKASHLSDTIRHDFFGIRPFSV